MTKETRTFFAKYWQALAIFITIQIITGFAVNIGSVKIALSQVEMNKNSIIRNCQSIEILETSTLELQFNQMRLANETDVQLPYQYTLIRGEN